MSRFVGIGLIFILSIALPVYAQNEDARTLRGNPIAGKTKSAVCVACHNLDGNSTTPAWPKIAGLAEEYIVQQLLDFQKGEKGPRYEPTMYGITQPLSAQDIADLAAFYATQTMTVGAADPSKVALGQIIYRGGNLTSGVPACLACHGPTGAGNYLANFPRLGGQNSDYIIAQLNKFRNNQRSNDANNIMRDIAGMMTDKEIEAVASYVAGLH
ncbi:MAG TPA: c-type cytochrome [Gammaproteobacteria bacterium]|nr:c-type cytochrome [Gammaproteobacteria bacterium]